MSWLTSVCSVDSSLAVLFFLLPALKNYHQLRKKAAKEEKKRKRQPRLGNTKPLDGRHKWLGGAVNHDKTAIFAIPSHSRWVLKITPDFPSRGKEKVETIGGLRLPGNYKYLRAILGQDNMIYGVPCFAKKVLKIDPSTSELTEFGTLPEGDWMWHGGAIAPCGTIFGVPCNAESVLKICPKSQTVSLIGDVPKGRTKWYGALLGRDGCVYGMPYKAKGVLRINPRTDDVRVIGDFKDSFKWHGGTVGADGCIYAFPSHADSILRIIPPEVCPKFDDDHSVRIEELPILSLEKRNSFIAGKYKWGGGATDREGNIYGIPSDATCVLKLNPFTGATTTFGDLSDDHNKWQGGVLGDDGNIYCVPCNADYVLVINPSNMELSEIGKGVIPAGRDKFQGGFSCGLDGNIYCLPESAPVILKIELKTQEVSTIENSMLSMPE